MKLKLIPILLCAALLLCVPVQAGVLGEALDGYSVLLAEGAVLTETGFWDGSAMQTEHYLTLAPGSAAVPVAVSSDPLWQKQAMEEAAEALRGRGLRVLGGSNGGFYTVATGEPVGLVVSGGVLRADDAWLEAVGFRADGSVIFGKPETRLTLRGEGISVALEALNRAAGSGMRLWTADCTAAVKPAGKSLCVLCTAEDALRLGGSTALTVERIWETEERVTVPEDGVLLMQPLPEEETSLPAAELLSEGTELTLECSCAPGWEDVDSALGILYPLIEDGKLCTGLARDAAPRTAVGVKADGTVILYTVDGRQSG